MARLSLSLSFRAFMHLFFFLPPPFLRFSLTCKRWSVSPLGQAVQCLILLSMFLMHSMQLLVLRLHYFKCLMGKYFHRASDSYLVCCHFFFKRLSGCAWSERQPLNTMFGHTCEISAHALVFVSLIRQSMLCLIFIRLACSSRSPHFKEWTHHLHEIMLLSLSHLCVWCIWLFSLNEHTFDQTWCSPSLTSISHPDIWPLIEHTPLCSGLMSSKKHARGLIVDRKLYEPASPPSWNTNAQMACLMVFYFDRMSACTFIIQRFGIITEIQSSLFPSQLQKLLFSNTCRFDAWRCSALISSQMKKGWILMPWH